MMHRQTTKRILAWVLAAALLLLPAMALAVNVSAAADKSSVRAGDTVEVTITVTGKGMSIAEGIFTYDPAVLTYLESEGGASDGFLNLVSAAKGGADTLTARIRFTAAGAGEAKVEASIEKVTGYDGAPQEGAKASVSVAVSAPDPTPTPVPLDYAKEGAAAQNVQGAEEAMYIWKSLENVTVPSRYSVVTLEYHGETVAAAQVQDSDAPALLYLSNAAGDVGSYYIYNAAADTLYPYRTVNSVSKAYILLEPDGSVALPDGFVETTITIDEKDYPAWKSQDAQGDIYLLYARNPDGEVGYYTYSPADASLQRYAVMPARPAAPDLPEEGAGATTPTPTQPEATPTPQEPAEGEMILSRTVFLLLCAAIGVLLLVIVGMLIYRSVEKARRRRRAAERRAARRAAEQELERENRE